MKLSIIMPVYKAEAFIEETIQSVLSQSFTDYELILVDDCGGDASIDIAASYADRDTRISIITNDANMGIAYSRNRGISYSRGEYIALLDDDDLMTGERLKEQVEFLDANPDIGAVGGAAQWIDENGDVIRDVAPVEKNPLKVEMYLLFRNIFNNGEMMFRRSVIDEHDIRYQDNCFGMEDFRFWIDFTKVAKISCIDSLVLKKRVTDNNETSRNKTQKRALRAEKYLELQKHSLTRSGFVVDDRIEAFLRSHFGEESIDCTSFIEITDMSEAFNLLLTQATKAGVDYYTYMANWFSELLEHNTMVILRDNNQRWRCDVPVMFDYYQNRLQELEPWLHEVEEGKNWLEAQYFSGLDRIAELEKQLEEMKALSTTEQA